MSSSSENEDPVNPENANEHAGTRDESAIEHLKKPYEQGDIIPIAEGEGETPRKKRPWDSEEEKERTMTFKRIRFEAIPEEAQNNWEVPKEMAKYAKKYFEKYVCDKELKDSITFNSPVPTNLPKVKNMDDYFVELVEDQRKKKKIALVDTFKKLQSKILTIMGPLSKVWYTVGESLAGGSREFDVDEMSQYIDQTILLIGQALNSVFYSRRMNVLIGVGTENVKAKNTLKNQASLLEEDSKELFGKSFRKHMVATAKAKKESKEIYRKSRANNSDKGPFERAPHYRTRMGGGGGRFVTFTTFKFSRGQSTSSSQPSQGSQPPWKSKRPFGKSFLNKKGSLSQHNLTLPKTHFPEIVPMHQLKHVHPLVLNLFPKGEIGNIRSYSILDFTS